MEQLSKDIVSNDVDVRTQAVCNMANINDKRTDEALLTVVEHGDEPIKLAAIALVKKGRDYQRSKITNPNPIIEELSAMVGNAHIPPCSRYASTWILGEIGSRKALPLLVGIDTEIAYQAREKLGYYSTGRAYEIPMSSLIGNKVDLLSVEPDVVMDNKQW